MRTIKKRQPKAHLHNLRAIVQRQLPAWFDACSAEADTIVMHETAFGSSPEELFLLGCALKYAAYVGKAVHVACGAADSTTPLSFRAAVEATFYESDKLRRRKTTRRRPAL
ncbi:MAG TPA: hypothetical protein VHT23_04630 [Gemmatimonadaceae bacterium]|nr:hypothetical protein [Gemmatimonadaceae bacterium]